MTWFLAERDGFSIIPASEVGRPLLIGTLTQSLRGFQKTSDNVTLRVFTSASWIRAPDQGQTFYRWCWASASVGSRDHTINSLAEVLGLPSFRSEKVRLFAWIPRPDGAAEPVSRSKYMREHNVLAREQGMRQILVRALNDGVSIGYASPRDEATYREFDFAGPEPIPAPPR